MVFGRMWRNWVRVLGSLLAPEAYTVCIQLLSEVLFLQRKCHDNIHFVRALYWGQKKKKHICHHPTAIHFDSTFSSPGEKDSQEWLRKSRDENSVADTYSPQKCVVWPFGSFFFPLRSLQVICLCPWQTTLAPEICVYQTSSSFILSFLFICDCSLGMAFYCSKCGSSDAVHLIPEGTESIALDSGSHLLHSILPAPYSTLNISHCLSDEKSLGYWLLNMSGFSSAI